MKETKPHTLDTLENWLRAFQLTVRQKRDDVGMACEIHLAHVRAIERQTIEVRRVAGAATAIYGALNVHLEEARALREVLGTFVEVQRETLGVLKTMSGDLGQINEELQTIRNKIPTGIM